MELIPVFLAFAPIFWILGWGAFAVIEEIIEQKKDKQLPPWKQKKHWESRSDGSKDMARAIYQDVRKKLEFKINVLAINGNILQKYIDQLDKRLPEWNPHPTESQVAEAIISYESLVDKIYDFDPSLGQTNEKHMMSDDSVEFTAYINAGMSFLDKVDEEKIKLIDGVARKKQRELGLKEVNHRWTTINHELTKLRSDQLNSISEKEQFDKMLKGEIK